MSIIRPVRELRNNYPEIAGLARETNQPIHITNNGRDDTVLLSEEAYEMLKHKALIDYKLLEAELYGGEPMDARQSLHKIRERVEGYFGKAQN
jgi:prevent-host-death family protein